MRVGQVVRQPKKLDDRDVIAGNVACVGRLT